MGANGGLGLVVLFSLLGAPDARAIDFTCPFGSLVPFPGDGPVAPGKIDRMLVPVRRAPASEPLRTQELIRDAEAFERDLFAPATGAYLRSANAKAAEATEDNLKSPEGDAKVKEILAGPKGEALKGIVRRTLGAEFPLEKMDGELAIKLGSALTAHASVVEQQEKMEAWAKKHGKPNYDWKGVWTDPAREGKTFPYPKDTVPEFGRLNEEELRELNAFAQDSRLPAFFRRDIALQVRRAEAIDGGFPLVYTDPKLGTRHVHVLEEYRRLAEALQERTRSRRLSNP